MSLIKILSLELHQTPNLNIRTRRKAPVLVCDKHSVLSEAAGDMASSSSFLCEIRIVQMEPIQFLAFLLAKV